MEWLSLCLRKSSYGKLDCYRDLSVGGVTPDADVMAQAIELIQRLGATVMVMIRPRGGDFAYSEDELVAMESTSAVIETDRSRRKDLLAFWAGPKCAF